MLALTGKGKGPSPPTTAFTWTLLSGEEGHPAGDSSEPGSLLLAVHDNSISMSTWVRLRLRTQGPLNEGVKGVLSLGSASVCPGARTWQCFQGNNFFGQGARVALDVSRSVAEMNLAPLCHLQLELRESPAHLLVLSPTVAAELRGHAGPEGTVLCTGNRALPGEDLHWLQVSPSCAISDLHLVEACKVISASRHRG